MYRALGQQPFNLTFEEIANLTEYQKFQVLLWKEEEPEIDEDFTSFLRQCADKGMTLGQAKAAYQDYQASMSK